jgi:acyl transferase domain-containing protein
MITLVMQEWLSMSSRKGIVHSVNNGYEPIAIIGASCRFPGDTEDLESIEEFEEFIMRGGDAIRPTPHERWNSDVFYSSDESAKGRLYVRNGSFLRWDYKNFDAALFGISPKEAAVMDPQQRLILEVATDCLYNAKADFDALAESPTGVFIGGFMLDHFSNSSHPAYRERMGSHSATSATMTMLSNRLSFTLGLRGPSLTVDTACSSSLVATHLACRALHNRDADLCLAGGVNFMLRPETTIMMCKGQFLTRDGRSKSFDSSADGYGRGEGCGIVALKRLRDAQADGDDVISVIIASGVNQDGATPGITVPSAEAQASLMKRVYSQAGVSAKEIDMVEAHGTGTPVGDPLESKAIRTILKADKVDHNVALTSLKSGLGHQEAAAGVAGLLKSSICVRAGKASPQAWLEEINPAIQIDDSPLYIPQDKPVNISRQGCPTIAAVNSFGYGGTNVHVMVADYA